MKLALLKDYIPVPGANTINFLKHAEGFFNLGYDVEVLGVTRFVDDKWKFKIKNLHNFYNINKNIKIKYFRGNLFHYFTDFTQANNFFTKFIYKYNPAKVFAKIVQLLPKLNKYLDPEIKISNYCIKNKFDLAYCRGNFRAIKYNIINKIPTVIESHYNFFPFELEEISKLTKSKYFKGIITISNFIKQNYIKQGFPDEKILVLEDAVELENFDKITNDKTKIRKKLNLPLDKKIILYTGKMRYDRGINTILDAAKILDNQAFSFYLLGANKIRLKIWENYLKKNNIQADVNILEFKPHKLIPYYLKAADILLAQYSLNCQSLKWMSPIKIFEYMGSKTPIIATNAGRMGEICNNNECLLTNPDDPRDLSEKIKFLINDKNLRNKLAQNAYQKAKMLTYKKRCQKIIEFVQN